MRHDFHSPKNLLGGILRGMLENITKEQQAGVQVLRGWEGIVGKALSEKSRVADIKKGCLHIAVREGGAMQLMLMKKRDILYKLGRQYPGLDIKDIHVFVDKVPEQAFIKELAVPKAQKQAQIAEKTKDEISDEEFKELMQRIKAYGKEKK